MRGTVLLVIVILLMVVLAGTAPTVAAPAPLAKEIKVGLRFRSWNYVLEVWKIEGQLVYYQDWEFGNRDFMHNPTTKAELRKLLKDCPQVDIPAGRSNRNPRSP